MEAVGISEDVIAVVGSAPGSTVHSVVEGGTFAENSYLSNEDQPPHTHPVERTTGVTN